MTAPSLLIILITAQVSITLGVMTPPRETPSSRGQLGAPSDARVAGIEAAFQRFKMREAGATYPNRYFWSDANDPSLVRYLYLSGAGFTVPGVHIVKDGQQPISFDGGCFVVSGEHRFGAEPVFRCNNKY